MAVNPQMISSPLSSIDNNRPRWRRTAVVVANALCLWGTHVSLVQVSSPRTATAVYRRVVQSTARVRSRQGTACVVAGLHVVGELLVLLTFQSFDRTL